MKTILTYVRKLRRESFVAWAGKLRRSGYAHVHHIDVPSTVLSINPGRHYDVAALKDTCEGLDFTVLTGPSYRPGLDTSILYVRGAGGTGRISRLRAAEKFHKGIARISRTIDNYVLPSAPTNL